MQPRTLREEGVPLASTTPGAAAPRPWIVGHRGFSGRAPENTLAAFRLALASGVDAVECDVHLTADGQLAVIHDSSTDRTTGTPGRIAERTMAELHALDAGQGEPIPELGELLDLLGPATAHVLIELKAPGTPAPALERVLARGLLDRTAFISFYPELLVELRRLEPRARTGFLLSKPGPDAVTRTLELGANAIDVHFAALSPEFVAAVRAAGLILWSWTPNAEADLRRTLDARVDGITTDHPDRLQALLGAS